MNLSQKETNNKENVMKLKDSYIEEQERLLAEVLHDCDLPILNGYHSAHITLRVRYLIDQIERAQPWHNTAVKALASRCVREGCFWYATHHIATLLPEKERVDEIESILRKCMRAKKYQESKIVVEALPNNLRARYLRKIARKEFLGRALCKLKLA